MSEITDLTQIIKRGRIRAKGNDIITPEFAAKVGAAHATYLGSKGILVIAREYNNLNRMIKRSYVAGVMSGGVDLLNLHPAPAPVLQFCIRRFGANGGVYLSSGSSLEGEISIRLFDSAGIEYNVKNIESVNEFFKNNKIKRVKSLDIGTITDIPATQDIYKKAIPQFVNRKIFKKRPLRVVIDCSYGPTSLTIPNILSELHMDVIAINSYESDRKATEVFPNLTSIKNCVNIVKASKADLGVILDTDGSRALFIDDTGTVLNYEELMMFFIAYDKNIKNSKGNPIIASQSSSKVLDQYCESSGFRIIKTHNFPGEISRQLREERAAFGGSDTFKFYFPQYGPFSDAVFTTMKILEIMTIYDMPISTLIRTFPRTILAYKTLPVKSNSTLGFSEQLKGLLRENQDETIDYQDIILGIKIVKEGIGWIIIAPSLNTDSIEFTAEGNNPQDSEDLIKLGENILKPIMDLYK